MRIGLSYSEMLDIVFMVRCYRDTSLIQFFFPIKPHKGKLFSASADKTAKAFDLKVFKCPVSV